MFHLLVSHLKPTTMFFCWRLGAKNCNYSLALSTSRSCPVNKQATVGNVQYLAGFYFFSTACLQQVQWIQLSPIGCSKIRYRVLSHVVEFCLPYRTASLPLVFSFANDTRQPISAEKVNLFTHAMMLYSWENGVIATANLNNICICRLMNWIKGYDVVS